jgi:hypothetical protein
MASPAEDVTVINYYGSAPRDEIDPALYRDNDGDDFADGNDDFV